jgi:5-methylthioadenosine/S-adenosylhomocysteine deaminase
VALILEGTVVTMDDKRPIVKDGAVYVTDDGLIDSVGALSAAVPAGFQAARRVKTDAVIYPGLIDLHSHIGYNTLPLWSAKSAPFTHHDSWPGKDDYDTAVTWPYRIFSTAAPEAVLKYAEVKALIGGTTAIQGKPRTSRTIDGWLVRVIDDEQFGQPGDFVQTATIPKPPAALDRESTRLAAGHAVFVPHVAEGKRGSIVHKEFELLDGHACVQPGLIGIHATALLDADFAKLGSAQGAIVWSPFSNLWLYHETTDVAAARAHNVRVCLGSDWSPSGTKHLLGELKVADLYNRQQPKAQRISARKLCALVTANPGDALAVAWGQRIGRIQPNTEADLVVVERRRADPYQNLIKARELDVQLVLVGGRPHYGVSALMQAAGATDAEPITIKGEKRSVRVRLQGHKDAEMSWSEVIKALEKVRSDPVGSWHDANDALAAWGGPLDAPEAPLVLLPDMPEGPDANAFGVVGEPPPDLVIPPLDPLWHDQAFFDALTAKQPPLLDKLSSYYA